MIKHFFTLCFFVFSGLASAQPYTWSQPLGPDFYTTTMSMGDDYYSFMARNNNSRINSTGQALSALNDRAIFEINGLKNEQMKAQAGAAALAGLDVPTLESGQTWTGISAGAHRGRGALAVGIAHSFSAGTALKFSASTTQSFSVSIGKKW